MRFYLIKPKFEPTIMGLDYAAPMLLRKTDAPPLGLLTMAAMIPPGHDAAFCDENVSAIDWEADCDFVCLTGMHLQMRRMREIARRFRARGVKVIAGGPSVMAVPDRYREAADILIVGEAERIWPRCLADLERGGARDRYVETEHPDLSLSPVPRFDLINVRDYMSISLQTTRGCPLHCEFCDIITLYGRRIRRKPVANVLKELEALASLGADNLIIVDDNLIGDPGHARELFTEVVKFRDTLEKPFSFSCQATINLARNEALMDTLYRAGCRRVFIGIETPRTASLEEAKKLVNTRRDLAADVARVQSAGLSVMAGALVGFDSDDPGIFQEQVDFINEAGIPAPTTGILGALPQTPLYKRLEKEGRLRFQDFWMNSEISNIEPKSMTLRELNDGFIWMVDRVYHPDAFARRSLAEIRRLERTTARRPGRRSPVLYLALGWILLWYLFDPTRRKLLRCFWLIAPRILLRHPASVKVAVERLVQYRHITRWMLHFRECRGEAEAGIHGSGVLPGGAIRPPAEEPPRR